MINYAARRVVQSVSVVVAALILVFVMTRLIGDPVSIMLPPDAPAEARDQLRTSLGLDQSIATQLGAYLSGVVTGDLGDSLWQKVPSLPLVLSKVPATLFLAGVALLMAIPAGIALGTVAALRPGSVLDRAVHVLSYIGTSVVHFWLALMLILIFPISLGLFKTGGFGGYGLQGWSYVFLPALALAFRPFGRIAVFTYSSVLEELRQPYVKTARAKGCGTVRVVGHALKNAGVPIVTTVGDDAAELLGGTIVIETIFAWPGLGLMMIQSITNRDFVLVQTTALVIAVIVILVYLVVDLTYTAIDPKIEFK
ncbi:ABC transporter permease [Pseudonocardia sp.]|uniref:ABC transporter permease n=1 Tax=Pseudonocardia sp. TaxID=60912 RepID=UPI003D0E004D